jgi:hypothetical protein
VTVYKGSTRPSGNILASRPLVPVLATVEVWETSTMQHSRALSRPVRSIFVPAILALAAIGAVPAPAYDLTIAPSYQFVDLGTGPAEYGYMSAGAMCGDQYVGYGRVLVGGDDPNAVNPTGTQAHGATYTPKLDEYVLFVHGWNMEDWEKDRWAETVFKRLWWQNYKGYVGGFQWPTLVGVTTSYDISELRAWRSAQALNGRITSLDSAHPGQVRVIAHSMGNVVIGEALRQSSLPMVHTYLAAQAAISAHCYDSTIIPYWSGYITPNVYGYYTSGGPPSAPYLVANSTRAASLVQYFNTADWALGWWQTNNQAKPDLLFDYTEGDANVDTYYPPGGDRFWYVGLFPGDERTLTFPDDRFEIFAFCAESRSRALGREPSVAGFDLARNLGTFGYDDSHWAHSREFRSNIVAEKPFWKSVRVNCDLSYEGTDP